MPDLFNARENTRASEGAPQDWQQAFAALPMETLPGDGWARISRTLDVSASRHRSARRERRTTWLIGAASAAVVVLAAWSPLLRWLQSDASEARPPAVAATTQGLRGPAAPVRAEPGEARIAAQRVDDAPAAATHAARSAAPPVHRKSSRGVRATANRSRVGPEIPTAHLASQASEPGQQTISASATAAASDVDPLQKLKSQSAQLEALVALARDDRVGNPGSDLLSGELDASIAAIDASLSQADVADARKQELWQQRVDLLQQLAGVEATSRWLAAQGMSNDTTLVSVD